MAQIKVVISPEGDVEIETSGFRGKACLDATAELEEALGTVGQREMKPEFRQEEESESRNYARR